MSFRFLRWLHRKGVSRKRLRGSWLHRLLGNGLFAKDLWSFSRRPVLRGWIVGCLAASNPFMGLQIVLSLPFVFFFRANLFVVIALILTTNPLTIAPFLAFCYWIGNLILGTDDADAPADVLQGISVWDTFKDGAGATLLGCAVVGVTAALAGATVIHFFWKEKVRAQRTPVAEVTVAAEPAEGAGARKSLPGEEERPGV